MKNANTLINQTISIDGGWTVGGKNTEDLE